MTDAMRPDKAASPVDVSPIDDGDQGYINALALSDVVLSEGNVVSTDVSDNAIVLAARQLKLKLHRFLTEQPAEVELRSEGKAVDYQRLIDQLEVVFKRQHEINKTNAQLNIVNYVASMSVLSKNRHLERAIKQGQERIVDLETEMVHQCDTILSLESAVRSLDTEVEGQRTQSEQLRAALRQTEQHLEQCMDEYRQEMTQQKKLLDDQRLVTEKLNQSQVHRDVFIDAGILIGALAAVNMTLVDYPLGFVVSVVFRSGNARRRAAAQQLTKMLLLVALYNVLRSKAQVYGLHSGVGSLFRYAGNSALGYVGWR